LSSEPALDRRAALSLRDVSLSFEEGVGVFDLDLEVAPGTIFGLIGPSGSGKTTTVRLLLGLYSADRGEVRVLGQDPRASGARARERIGYMPQHFVLYPSLSVRENLDFVASLYGLGYWARRRRLAALLEFVELADAKGRLAARLSGGMQRRLLLAGALVHDPLVLFADEPTAGIDPVLRGKFWDHLRALGDEGRTIFVTTQYVAEAAHCDLVGVMRDGRLIHLDTPDALRRKAVGGEIVRIVVPPERRFEAAQRLMRGEPVRRVHVVTDEPGQLDVYVDEAGEALPAVIRTLGDAPAIEVRQAEKHVPPFDEVFVRLMDGSRGAADA